MGKKPIAVLYADGHMAKGSWAHRTAHGLKGDASFSLRQIVDKAIELDVPVLGAGDLLDKAKVMSWPVTTMFYELDRLHEAGLALYYIRGQHEGDSDFLSAHVAGIHVDDGKYHELPTGETVYGLDYQPIGALQERLNNEVTGDIDILMLHQVWGNLMGDIACPQGNWEQIPDVEFVLTGDYHEEYIDETVSFPDGRNMRVINPGSVCLQKINEPADKYFCVLNSDFSVKKIQLRTRQLIETDLIYDDESMDKFVANISSDMRRAEVRATDLQLPAGLCRPLLWVEYNADVANAKQRITKAVNGKAHLFLKQRPIQRPEVLERLRQRRESGDTHATTLESELFPYLEAIEKKHLGPRCQRLLQADDAFVELTKMKDEYINQE